MAVDFFKHHFGNAALPQLFHEKWCNHWSVSSTSSPHSDGPVMVTPWKTNMDPENHWLVKHGKTLFQEPLSGSMLVFGSVVTVGGGFFVWFC